MSEFMFGSGRGRISEAVAAKVNKIAGHHGCTFVNINNPGNGWIYWFTGPNRGDPFDRELSAQVFADLERAKLCGSGGLRLKTNTKRGGTTKFIIELEVRGDPAHALHVIDMLLDAGLLQDEINDNVTDGRAGLHVESAIVRLDK